ncbi:MAG: hypothetical protein KDJ28_01540 [Candidatus Competibacteraceae bacterium]|nr:hypothetical protein [Candidatus Competibacteraceae bacterium]
MMETPTPLHDRQRAARLELAEWQQQNPHFSSRELLDAWKAIRVKWGLSKPDAINSAVQGREYRYPKPEQCRHVEPETCDLPAKYPAVRSGNVWDGEGP